MRRSVAIGVLMAFVAGSAFAQGRSGGGRSGGGRSGGWGGGHAVHRGGRHVPSAGAVHRQPRPYGASHGSVHGGRSRGQGGYTYGHGRYGYPRYGYGRGYYPYYGYRPYYAGYPYYGYGYAPYYGGAYYSPYGFGVGVSFGIPGGYVSAGYTSPAPYYATGPAVVVGNSVAVSRATAAEPSEAEIAEVQLAIAPEDAVVYVDGEFAGTARQAATLRLAPGRHHVEVTRPGFRVESREMDVAPGSFTSVRIDLQRP